MHRIFRICLVFIIVFSAGGCTGIQKTPLEKNFYALALPDPFLENRAKTLEKKHYLSVKDLDMTAGADTHFFTYLTRKHQYIYDYYNEFTTHPSRQITENIKKALYASGMFTPFLNQEKMPAQYRMSGGITQLYGDIQDKERPLAVMEIHLVMETRQADMKSIILSRRYHKSIRVDHFSAENMAAGWNQAFLEITEQFISDLSTLMQ